ncbi:hypothetical protein [Streptomyces laurentii]|uniref:hypothetical protein n=1 Tax=Streptomyces laurentii TaxID=39478 RepID=UPI0036C873AF
MKRLHEPADLAAAAAGLLDHLGPVTGLRAGLHPEHPHGVRLLDQTGRPYTDDVAPVDRIGAALGAPVDHQHHGPLSESMVTGTWQGTSVHASHLYSHVSDGAYPSKPCTDPADVLGRRLRALVPWLQQPWAQQAESVHVYDETGAPLVHVVLRTTDSLDEALGALLDATGPLQYRAERKHDDVAHGSVLLGDGTVVTASVITP